METLDIIEFMSSITERRMNLALSSENCEENSEIKEQIRVARKIEFIIIERHEDELRAELAPELSILRLLPMNERMNYYFEGRRFIAALVLLPYLLRKEN
jgi:hypothetical protein